MQRNGLSVSPGIAVGPALVLPRRRSGACGRDEDSAARRFARYCAARDRVKQELNDAAARLDSEAGGRGDVLLAQSVLLEDPVLEEEIRAAVEEFGIEAAVEQIYRRAAQLLAGLDDPRIRARSADYLDMEQRILLALRGETVPDLSRLEEPCILVAEELLPSQAAMLDRNHVLGIVTQAGGDLSHTAIIARSYGIPTVMGVDGIPEQVSGGDLLALEARSGQDGLVWIRPDRDVADRMRQKGQVWQEEAKKRLRWLSREGRTRDGVSCSVLLNLARGSEEELAAAPCVDGVGLFRTEFLYLDGAVPPTEEAQYGCYRQVLETFAPHPVTLRTIDLGGDKTPDYLENRDQLRGIALSLAHPELLRPQLRAALRANVHGNLRLMLPMVTGLEELERGIAFVRATEDELRREGQKVEYYQLGVMIEVPELARAAALVAERVDFASLGTNDLCQSLLGNDRMRSAPEERYHPQLLQLVKQVVDAFAAAGKDLSLCGELAGDVLATELLVGLGLRKLSVQPLAVAELKERLSAVDSRQAGDLAEWVLCQTTARQVQEYLKQKQQEGMTRV